MAESEGESVHSQTAIPIHLTGLWVQLAGQKFDSTHRHKLNQHDVLQCPKTKVRTYNVDFPAPFAPTIAILESRPTSKWILLRTGGFERS